MPPRPRGRAGAEQDGFHASDRERIQVAVESTIARPFKCGRHAVVDEHRTSDVTDRGREQHAPRLFTHAVIGGAIDGEIALLERVGEREDAAEILIHSDLIPMYAWGPALAGPDVGERAT